MAKVMSRRGVLMFFAFLGVAAFAGLAAETACAAPEAVAPCSIPERVLLTWAGDPATSQAVTWRTLAPVEAPVGQVVPWSADPKFGATAALVPGAVQSVPLGEGTVYECRVKFEGLKPGTRYGYRVGDGKAWSPWYSFLTASDKPEPFRFVYVGDAQTEIRSLWPRLIMAAYAEAPDMRFMMHAGDLVNHGYDDALWGEWCGALGAVGAMVPNVPAPGNHDEHQSADYKNVASMPQPAPWWRHRFALPENGPADVDFLKGVAYYIDYQGLRVVVIDSNLYDDPEVPEQPKAAAAQTAWLESVLANNPNRWTIVMHHHPLYSVAEGRDNEPLRQVLLPVYQKYDVDLVLQGHDHAYGRTVKLRDSAPVGPSEAGTVYAVSMSGAKMYDKDPKFASLMAKTQDNTQLFQVIEVDGDRLSYRAHSVTDELIDGFDLVKDKEGKSTLKELTDTKPAVAPAA